MPMKIGKTKANSTAGDPVSSPASFRPRPTKPAKNLLMDRIVASPQPRFSGESCARSRYSGLIFDAKI
jgi:hypothetical protein